MLVGKAALTGIYTSFSTLFNQALAETTILWDKIATMAPSTGSRNDYKWLGTFPMLREWVGERYLKPLEGFSYSIVNKSYEATVELDRDDIDDDNLGIYTPVIKALGANAKVHPDVLVFQALLDGFSKNGYDGQFFFDTDHPVGDGTVSNMQAGAQNPWFLIDTSKFILPLIYQERKAPEFVAHDDPSSEAVFKKKKYSYGVDTRGNAGYGLWQLAFGSKETLDATNFNAAFAALMAVKNDEGQPLGVTPTLLVVGGTNRTAALDVVKADKLANGASNPNQGAVEILIAPRLL